FGYQKIRSIDEKFRKLWKCSPKRLLQNCGFKAVKFFNSSPQFFANGNALELSSTLMCLGFQEISTTDDVFAQNIDYQ
ncbi:MAG TPA: hypothetical protein DCS93_36160, partial [Microscillaceae bacterium]|nr:hypothetical protein [Microscillaceae bacterium]